MAASLSKRVAARRHCLIMRGESSGWFADTTLDGVFLSRFGNDFLVYDQSRFGYAFGPRTLRGQLSWNANLTFDSQRQYWANFGETGPGIQVASSLLPQSTYVTLNLLRGAYLIRTGNPRRPNFDELPRGVLVCVHSLAWRSSWRGAPWAPRTPPSFRTSASSPTMPAHGRKSCLPSASSGSPPASRGSVHLWQSG